MAAWHARARVFLPVALLVSLVRIMGCNSSRHTDRPRGGKLSRAALSFQSTDLEALARRDLKDEVSFCG